MSSGGDGGDPGGRLYTLEEMDRYVLPRTADIRLTAEDVVLLLLQADPRPIGGKAALASQAFLAVTGPLARSGVEPIAFRRGRGGRPRSAHVELALDHLAFTKNVAVSGHGKRGMPAITITAKGSRRIAEKRGRLPVAVRSALARKRAGWGGAAPECGMEDATYVHNREILERLPAPSGLGGSGRRKGARRAGKGDTRGGGGTEPTAGTVAGSTTEECHAEACALAAGGDHEAAISLFERAILLDPAHAASHRGKAESLSALGRHEEASKFRFMVALLERGGASTTGVPEDDAAASDGTRSEDRPPTTLDARPRGAVQGDPAPDKKRHYPRIPGFPSLVGTALEAAKKGEIFHVLTQFQLYRSEQLSQNDGIIAQNAIHGLLSNFVYPLVLRSFGDRPVPKNFDLYAVQIIMYSKEEQNDVLINEDVRLSLACLPTRNGLKDGDAVLVKDIKEIALINELDRDPDAAAISLVLTSSGWLGKFDAIYNRKTVHQKLKHAVKFLKDSIRDTDTSLESRYDLLWSGCELLGECMLLLHNMLKPRSSHKQIQKALGDLLRMHNSSYIEQYNEIAQIRESLRYGPPHPDRSGEAKRKLEHLQDASMEFAAFAIGFLGRRQVSAASFDPRTADVVDPADGSGKADTTRSRMPRRAHSHD